MKNRANLLKPYLFEVAYETCNQIGGIYTVIRSKAPYMVNQWGESYVLLGPNFGDSLPPEFEEKEPDPSEPFYKTIKSMQKRGYEVHFGYWLVSGHPKVILFSVNSFKDKLNELKEELNTEFQLEMNTDGLGDRVVLFSHAVNIFFKSLVKNKANKDVPFIAHFHEWMASIPLLFIAKKEYPISTVFTTHATSVGRFLASSDPHFYRNISSHNWKLLQKNLESHFKQELNICLLSTLI